jgi:tetratricopeptide (TPR) repeat protein
VALAPASARAHVGLADAYTRLGQLEAASEHLLRAIRLDPGNPAQYERLAQLYERLSRLDLAIVALRDALGAAGEWPRQRQAELAEALASLYERAGMSREAEHTRQRAAALRTP